MRRRDEHLELLQGAGHGLPASNTFGRGALDPELIRTPAGALYLLMALSRTKDNIGVVRLRADGTVVGGLNAAPTILASQSMPWHDGRDDSTLGTGAFLENPTMIREPHTGTYLLFFSAGQYRTAYYNTSFARCAGRIASHSRRSPPARRPATQGNAAANSTSIG